MEGCKERIKKMANQTRDLPAKTKEVYADEQTAIDKLRGHVKQDENDPKMILVSSGSIGIKLWGAIDYLCHYHGYKWRMT